MKNLLHSKLVRSLAILAIVIVAVSVGIGYGLQPASDKQMMADFYTHRDTFEQLRQMSLDDGQNMTIDINGYYWYAPALGPGVSETRQQDYQKLLREAGLVRIEAAHDEAALIMPARIFPVSIPTKSYNFSSTPPTWLTSGDTGANTFSPGQEPVICRPLEENWYICIDNRD